MTSPGRPPRAPFTWVDLLFIALFVGTLWLLWTGLFGGA